MMTRKEKNILYFSLTILPGILLFIYDGDVETISISWNIAFGLVAYILLYISLYKMQPGKAQILLKCTGIAIIILNLCFSLAIWGWIEVTKNWGLAFA